MAQQQDTLEGEKTTKKHDKLLKDTQHANLLQKFAEGDKK